MEKWGRIAVPLGLALFLLAGCDTESAQPPAAGTPAAVHGVEPSPTIGDTTNTPNANRPEETNSVVTNAANPKDDPEAGQPAQTPTNKPKVAPSDNYNASKPTLMGLSLNASKAAVIGKFGEPKSQHILADDAGSVQVFEYNDFAIGFKGDGRLEYVEVLSDRIDPGLRGLKVGQKTSDAIAALGKPNVNTGYVLTYESEGAVLKLDIDVTVDQVLSIKLFPGK